MALPQYKDSAAAMELFLDAIHHPDQPMARARSIPGTVKWVDGTELDVEALTYFEDNKEALELEYLKELADSIGAAKAVAFCHTVSEDWFSGSKGRRGPRVQALKAAVRQYLHELIQPAALASVLIDHQQDLPVASQFNADDIEKILRLNDQFVYQQIDAWKQKHPASDRLSSDEIFLRRGLALNELLRVAEGYREKDFINSYSLAFSSPEKFAQMHPGKIPAIINGDLHLFDHRILFFSPLVPGMPVGQLEFGIIPAKKALPLADQGLHAGIREYQLDPRPFDTA